MSLCSCHIRMIPMNLRNDTPLPDSRRLGYALAVRTCACVNTPGAQATVPTAPPGGKPRGHPRYKKNTNTTGLVPPPRIICNCPMEPVVSVTLTPIATSG